MSVISEAIKSAMLRAMQIEQDYDAVYGIGSYQKMKRAEKAKEEGLIVVTDEKELG